MRIRGRSRLDRRSAQPLIDRVHTGPPDRRGPVAELLAAVAAPPRPGELDGEEAAVAAFCRAYAAWSRTDQDKSLDSEAFR